MLPEVRRTSLGMKLLLALMTAVTIPSIVVAAILIRSGQQSRRAQVFTTTQAMAEVVADDIRDFIGGAESELQGAGLSAGFTGMGQPLRQATLRHLLDRNSAFLRVMVLGANGPAMSLSRSGPPIWSVPADALKQAYSSAMAGRTYVSPVRYQPDALPQVLIAVPLTTDAGRRVGSLAAVLSLAQLQRIVSDVYVGPSPASYAYVVDSSGRVLAHPRLGPKAIGVSFAEHPIVRESLSGRRDVEFTQDDMYTDPTGEKVVGTYRRLPELGWSVLVQQPIRAVFGPELRRVLTALGWTLVFALVFVLVGLRLVRMILQPIETLARGAETIGSGDLSCRIHLESGDELESLADALNAMAANLESSRRQLKQEHDRAVSSAREARTLYRVSQSLVSTIDLRERLSVIAENLAGVCHTNKVIIWLVEEDRLIPCAFYGLTQTEYDLFGKWEVDIARATRLTREALTSKQPVIVADTTLDQRLPTELRERLDVKSVLAVPFVFKDRPIGYAVTYQIGVEHRFTKYQVSLTQAVAAQAAIAIENSRAYERERAISETLQRSLLPSVPPSIGEFEIADVYAPALAEAEVGGDFYDLIELSPTRTAFVIADISGKGLNAAVYTAMVKYMTRAYAAQDLNPDELLERLNAAVHKYTGEQAFITLFYGILDIESKQLRYANAGHELPLLYGEERGQCMTLVTTGMALGVVPDARYGMETIGFVQGDVLFMYTDGASDVRRDGQFLGLDGLEAIFCESAVEGSADQIIAKIEKSIREYSHGQLRDDIALLVVKYRSDGDGAVQW